MDTTHVQSVNPLEIADWDARLGRFPAANFFHSAAWARVLHDTYRYQPAYFVTGKENDFEALLPVMEVSSWVTGRRGVSLPFTDECEPLGTDSTAFRHLFAHAQAHGLSHRWKYLECRGGLTWLDNTSASTSFHNHHLELMADDSKLFRKFDSSVRRAVRKAEQSNLTVEFSQSLESMRTFHGLLCLTRQRHGVPPQPFPFFANIQRHVLALNKGWVVLARYGGVPVAGAVFFHFGSKAIYKFGASNEAYQHLRANNLVMWQAIRHYALAGFVNFDFGRTSFNNEGLRHFKLSWGTKERQVDYTRYDLNQGRFVTARDSASGWHTRIFQHSPVFLSRLIGAALYRHIA